jgi:hypothetical protein
MMTKEVTCISLVFYFFLFGSVEITFVDFLIPLFGDTADAAANQKFNRQRLTLATVQL